MLYEFENPSDPYVFTAESREVAALTVFIISTAYGATPESGDENVPIFIFGGSAEWYAETFGRTPEVGFTALQQDVKESLESFMYGGFRDWTRYNAALNAIDDPVKRKAFVDEWQDGHGSMNNIGKRAHQLASLIKGSCE